MNTRDHGYDDSRYYRACASTLHCMYLSKAMQIDGNISDDTHCYFSLHPPAMVVIPSSWAMNVQVELRQSLLNEFVSMSTVRKRIDG